ncbi:hypothetical protein CSB37_02810 [bacterium DOLZORAL124_38_8]|nr:MAG: hypothetical protein CSB37_02810 [bacterium DOLZORAL124_38_8]
MQKFYFEAANQDGKKVSGYVEAEDKVSAHNTLKERKFAVFSLHLFNPEENQKQKNELQTFEFQGKDKLEQIVRGNVSALDVFQAYKTLRIDYEYSVDYLFLAELPEEEKEKRRLSGVDQDVLEWFEIEEIKERKRRKKNARKSDLKKEVSSEELSQEEQEQVLKLQQEISTIVQESFDLLQKNSDFLEASKKREIEDRLNLLSRLRRSNAVDHLQNLTASVLQQLQDDTIFLKNLSHEQKIEKQEEFKLFSSERGMGLLKTNMAALPIGINLSDTFDIDILKIRLKRAKILENIMKFLYEFFVVETVLVAAFFVVSSIVSLMVSNEQWDFYLLSSDLWHLFYVSILISLIFCPLYVLKNLQTHQKILYFMCATIFFVFCVIQFEALFFWTLI